MRVYKRNHAHVWTLSQNLGVLLGCLIFTTLLLCIDLQRSVEDKRIFISNTVFAIYNSGGLLSNLTYHHTGGHRDDSSHQTGSQAHDSFHHKHNESQNDTNYEHIIHEQNTTVKLNASNLLEEVFSSFGINNNKSSADHSNKLHKYVPLECDVDFQSIPVKDSTQFTPLNNTDIFVLKSFYDKRFQPARLQTLVLSGESAVKLYCHFVYPHAVLTSVAKIEIIEDGIAPFCHYQTAIIKVWK